jgi:hypothetical protein
LFASTSRAPALYSAVAVTLCDSGRITPATSAARAAPAAAVPKSLRDEKPLTVRRSCMNP